MDIQNNFHFFYHSLFDLRSAFSDNKSVEVIYDRMSERTPLGIYVDNMIIRQAKTK